jgi:hypothetical protein
MKTKKTDTYAHPSWKDKSRVNQEKFLLQLEETGLRGKQAFYNYLNSKEVRSHELIVGGSSLVTFFAHPAMFALSVIGYVNTYGNDKTLSGTGVHAGIEKAIRLRYSSLLEFNNEPKLFTIYREIISAINAESKRCLLGHNPKETIKEVKRKALKLYKIYSTSLGVKTLNVIGVESRLEKKFNAFLFRGHTDQILNIEYQNKSYTAIQDIKTSQKSLSAPGFKENEDLLQHIQNQKAMLKKAKLKKTPQEEADALISQANSLDDIIIPLQKADDEAKYFAQLDVAKANYRLQLGANALAYEAQTGKTIDLLQIDYLVDTKEAQHIQYIWAFTQSERLFVTEALEEIDEILSAYKAGTSSKLLFTVNPESFRGAELFEQILAIGAAS